MDCATCREKIEEVKNCKICGSEVCEICFEECSLLEMEEWLDEMPNICDRCHRIGCGDCITTCYQCWNIKSPYDLVCKDCSDVSKQNCEKHHHWDFCSQHSKDECSACASNQSYIHYGLEIIK